jgi:hypothetical protein
MIEQENNSRIRATKRMSEPLSDSSEEEEETRQHVENQ